MEATASLEKVFRICYRRYMEFSAPGRIQRGSRSYSWNRPDEEYAADFELTSKRTLSPEEWPIFRAHFLLQEPIEMCSRRFSMPAIELCARLRRIESKLGRAFRDLKPHPLFPLWRYFQAGRTLTDRTQ